MTKQNSVFALAFGYGVLVFFLTFSFLNSFEHTLS